MFLYVRNLAIVAPMVEQRIENSCVTGSSPVYGTSFSSRKIKNALRGGVRLPAGVLTKYPGPCSS